MMVGKNAPEGKEADIDQWVDFAAKKAEELHFRLLETSWTGAPSVDFGVFLEIAGELVPVCDEPEELPEEVIERIHDVAVSLQELWEKLIVNDFNEDALAKFFERIVELILDLIFEYGCLPS
ncbi:hypothetical protein IPA_07215 [Ignicoccus pacificus DSM 13166]|uniref:Uncharacterized protein n=1 Tax=Ignicoccus pacificus DSM 13166 TaxID=940294 RepID=A0A977KBP6_9CREN|nr:hypothetical protein IPA_07215 [Ignicoccus pacificus DSM 13166]